MDVSNIGRCMQLQEYKLLRTKSHDCHVFILLPTAFKELLHPGIKGALTKLSIFFSPYISSTLDKQRIEDLIHDAPLILCQLERKFPPSFFNSMEHLIVHLAYEAKLRGLVQYRWMYGNMLNPQKVEASKVDSYLFEEFTNFTQYYPEYEDPYKRSKTTRNKDNVAHTYPQVPIFNHSSLTSGKCMVLWMNEGKDFHRISKHRRTRDPNVVANRFCAWFNDYESIVHYFERDIFIR
ncbi:LOW QUALITY PROTEIN: hypothetical protein V2J09_022486 [Rumex salicifolius]